MEITLFSSYEKNVSIYIQLKVMMVVILTFMELCELSLYPGTLR